MAEQSEGNVAVKQIVLVVDDEPDILQSLQTLLELALPSVEVLTAESGPKALEKLQQHPVDLIISDFKMPGMTGLEFLDKAKAAAPGTPRILMTAFPDLDVAMRAINEAEIQNFITKPLDPEHVTEIIKKALGDRRSKVLRDRSFARSFEALRKRKPKP